MQASSQEGAAPFFLQGPREAGEQRLVEESPSRGRSTASASRLPVHLPKPPFRSHQPCVSQRGFSLSPSDEGKVLREATELPHGCSAAPELRPLEARRMLPPPHAAQAGGHRDPFSGLRRNSAGSGEDGF